MDHFALKDKLLDEIMDFLDEREAGALRPKPKEEISIEAIGKPKEEMEIGEPGKKPMIMEGDGNDKEGDIDESDLKKLMRHYMEG